MLTLSHIENGELAQMRVTPTENRSPEIVCLVDVARLCAISPQTHVIVITGHDDTAARILAMQIGAVAFLIKPFDDEQFLEVVHRALGHPDLRKKTVARAQKASATAGSLPRV